MKKILALVLAVVMIMAMTIPAFAATADDVAPCAACTGNHTYEEAYTRVSYACGLNGCVKTTIRYYKCAYCPANYTADPVKTVVAHDYQSIGTTSSGATIYECTQCKDVKTLN